MPNLGGSGATLQLTSFMTLFKSLNVSGTVNFYTVKEVLNLMASIIPSNSKILHFIESKYNEGPKNEEML